MGNDFFDRKVEDVRCILENELEPMPEKELFKKLKMTNYTAFLMLIALMSERGLINIYKNKNIVWNIRGAAILKSLKKKDATAKARGWKRKSVI